MSLAQRTTAAAAGIGLVVAGLSFVDWQTSHHAPITAPARPTRGVQDPFLLEFAGSYETAARTTGEVKEVALDAAPADVPLLDGRMLKVWAYNRQVPGPIIRVRAGELLRVRFTNHLPQPSTIHWHGVRVPNGMDGTPHVTQPPVEPGGSFIYEFVPRDPGTFWFHPHVRGSEQIERGLYGVLIVEDTTPLPYTRELVWVLDDWLLTPGREIVPEFNTLHDLAHDGRWGNLVSVNGDQEARVELLPGERVRIRILNAANARVFSPDFSGLDARVIAVDGMYTAAHFVPKGLDLAPGNRLDLDVRVPASDRGRLFTIDDKFTRQPIPLVRVAVLNTVPLPSVDFLPPAAHVPIWSDASKRPVTAEYHLNARRGGMFGIEWTINEEAYSRHDSIGAEHSVMTTLPVGAWSKLRFINDSYRLHPMHLHGVFFKLLARNGEPVNEPFWRDTVLMHAKETIEIGLVPVDRGKWMMHCHIQEHAEAGMMTLFEVR